MHENMVAAKAAIATFFTALGAFLGWRGITAVVWVVCMALDYISGTVAAMKAGEWCSAKAREGLWHKGGMILVVVVSAIADGIMAIICANLQFGLEWPSIILPLVLAWYIITEMGSVLENAVKMGANVPNWLVKLMKVGLKAVNTAGDAAANDNSDAQELNE